MLIICGTVAVDDKNTVFFFDDTYGYEQVARRGVEKGIPVPDGLKEKRKQLKSVVDCRAQAQPFSDPTEPDCIREAARVIYL